MKTEGILMGARAYTNAGLDAVIALSLQGLSPAEVTQRTRPYVNNDGTLVTNSEGELVANAILRKDEWLQFDTEVVTVMRDNLCGVRDLISRGLTYNAGDLGTIITQWQQASDMNGAMVSMSGVTEDENDSMDFSMVGVPIPIFHKGFNLNVRHLLASRRMGAGIDVTQGTVAARKVADLLESTLFNGTPKSVQVDGKVLYGYRTHPSRNTGSGSTWATTANIYPFVLAMIAKLEDDLVQGPYKMYVNRLQMQQLRALYDIGGGKFYTIYDLIMQMPEIEAIEASQAMPEGEVILIKLSREVVDMAMIQDVTTSQWDSLNGRTSFFQVWGAMAPRIKADYSGRCGIAHWTGAGTS